MISHLFGIIRLRIVNYVLFGTRPFLSDAYFGVCMYLETSPLTKSYPEWNVMNHRDVHEQVSFLRK